jgi:hypothetical protein
MTLNIPGVRVLKNIGASMVSMTQRAWGLGEDAADKSKVSAISTKKGVLDLGVRMEGLHMQGLTDQEDVPIAQADYVGSM